MTTTNVNPRLIVAFSKDAVAQHLNHAIVEICLASIKARGAFTIALSGGSLPQFLASINETFQEKEADPQLDKWHVLLADERCVPHSDKDSNWKALNEHLFAEFPVPVSQVHGINESLLGDAAAVASDYEGTVKSVLEKSGGYLDVAVLGFGPDGHTCSLFPHHALLKEDSKLVASLTDSPKPPPSRITLTLKVLNRMTRHVIFCGAGSSKGPIVKRVFTTLEKCNDPYIVPNGAAYKVTLETEQPAPYPCAMVVPNIEGEANGLTWIVDKDAMEEAKSAPSPY